MTCFDDLSIDLLIKIFNYFSFTELIGSFFGLQKRLDDAIRNYPSYIDLSKVIKRDDLQPFSFQCRTLILSGVDLESFQMNYSHLNLTSLQGVTFKKMNLLTLHSFIKQLPVQQLELINIKRLTWYYYPIDVYKEIWTIIMNSFNGNRLRYLYLPYHIRYWNIEKFSVEFISLRHATLEYISTNQMLIFLKHCPNLRQFKACLIAPHKDLFRCAISLPKLNHLTLNLHDEWSLDEIQQLLTICPSVKYLMLKLQARKELNILFEPITWQTLIEDKLHSLIYLRLRLVYVIIYPDIERCNAQEKFNHDEYWLQRKPQFQVLINEIHRTIL